MIDYENVIQKQIARLNGNSELQRCYATIMGFLRSEEVKKICATLRYSGVHISAYIYGLGRIYEEIYKREYAKELAEDEKYPFNPLMIDHFLRPPPYKKLSDELLAFSTSLTTLTNGLLNASNGLIRNYDNIEDYITKNKGGVWKI